MPVLDIAGLGLASIEKFRYVQSSGISQEFTENYSVLNSAYNLTELVRVVNDFGEFNGLGDFLGV